MQRIPVKSSSLITVGYSPEEEVLEVEFRSGRVYQYLGVPPRVHEELMEAESMGRYFNLNVRDQYRRREVSVLQPAAWPRRGRPRTRN